MQIKQENIIKWKKKYKTKDLPLLLALFFVAASSFFFLSVRAQLIIVL